MSSTVINTNVMSLNPQHNLRKSDNSLAQSLQRLSSGLRINSAKDDAAGLAISDRMTAMIKGNAQSIRNANDGISMVQTAEGALSTIGNDLQRMRELAVQSANDSNTALDRVTLDNEFQQLIRAIGRVANSTDFNTRKLLDGTLQSQVFQTGANQGNTIATTSVDARNTQLGSRQILGNEGVTEAQLKNGVQEIKGSFTVSISEVRGQSIVPIELEIDLSNPIFNPDVNPGGATSEGTKAGTTGLTTLEDVTRVVNNAIQRAIAGTEKGNDPNGPFANTFSYGEGTMSEADARLKLAQANVSAAIVTRNNGENTIILRGAFDSQFELRMDESVEMSLKAGRDVGTPAIDSVPPLTGTNSASSQTVFKLALAGLVPADDFVLTTYTAANGQEVIGGSGGVTAITIGGGNYADIGQLADQLNAASIANNLGLVFSLNAGELGITDTFGRGIPSTLSATNDATTYTQTNVSLVTAAGTSTITHLSSRTVDYANVTAGDLGVLKLTLGGIDYEVDLSGVNGDVIGNPNLIYDEINAVLAAATPSAQEDIAATVTAGPPPVITLTDAIHGRSISNVSLSLPSEARFDNLTPTFNDGVGENISNFSITIDGQRIDVDLTGVTEVDGGLDSLSHAVRTAIHGYQIDPSNPTVPAPFADVDVDVVAGTESGTHKLVILDPQGRNIETTRLSGPETIKLFDHEEYDAALKDPDTDNPYASEQVNLTQINVTTRYDSMLALNIIDGALNQISDLRSELGAV
ncbi:hypothetical protein, partial [Thiorhodospira sibirica]|uniref:flagellin N-terminal helical domain-containing protein n=1 Tax=Thiorhodospira sibirica TaxID=154347 RepID=UPI001C8E50C9